MEEKQDCRPRHPECLVLLLFTYAESGDAWDKTEAKAEAPLQDRQGRHGAAGVRIRP